MSDEQRQSQEPGTEEGDTAEVFAHPVRVQRLDAEEVKRLLPLARRMAADPSIFEDSPPFFFSVEASNRNLDSYFTRMDKTSLQNYAEDATRGVSFQNSHNVRELGMGRSVDGRYIGGQGNGIDRMEGDFYTLPGLNLNGVQTDDLIRGIRSGLVKDVSIGFYGGRFLCDICGRDLMRDWDCPHIPGMYYDPDDERASKKSKSEQEGKVLATATISDARLAEVSAVYEGATPGAAIIKAQQEADAGRLKPEAARVLEARYRIKLPGCQHNWRGVHIQESGGQPSAAAADSTKEDRMDQNETDGQQQQHIDRRALLLEACREVGLPAEGEPLETLRSLKAEAERAAALAAEVERLKPLEAEVERLAALADMGTQYRKDLIEETLEEGVRALGDRFRKESARLILQNQSLDLIKEQRDQYREIARDVFPGGRVTIDRAESSPRPQSDRGVPDSAFAA